MPSPAFSTQTRIEPQRALHMGLGAAAAPTLWAAYFAAAGAGVTYWWMTAWSRGQLAVRVAEPKSFKQIEAPKAAVEPKVDAQPVDIVESKAVEIAAVVPEAVAVQVAAAETVANEIEAAVDAEPAAKPARKSAKKSKA